MPLPVLNLDNKRFDEFIDEARRLIPRYAPEWTNHNLSDPGVTFIELFAWLTEMQIYHLNQIPEKNYLKYLKLLGVKPKPAMPAKVDLTFFADNLITISKGTRVATKGQEKNIRFETDENIDVFPVEIERITSYSNYKYVDLTEQNNELRTFYYPFGENPQAGDAFYLGFNFSGVIKGNLRLTVYLYEEDLPPKGNHGTEEPNIYPSAEIDWEYALSETKWSPLDIKMIQKVGEIWQEWDGWNGNKWIPLEEEPKYGDRSLGLMQSNVISFTIPSEVQKITLPYAQGSFFWIRAKLRRVGYEIPPRIKTIQLNTVSATAVITVGSEYLEKSSGLPDQTFLTTNKPILYRSQKVYVDSHEWEEADDFDASTPYDTHYILNRADGEIIFGNGIHGKIPTKGKEIKIDYRYGGEEEGNLHAEINWQLSNMQDIKGIKNLFPAGGGKKEESLDEAKFRARKELKVPYQAVTSEDFETIAKATPGIRVARVGVQILPKENKVKIVVVPYSLYERPIPSEGFKRTVCEHLDMHRLITTQIEIIEPEYVKVSITASVKIKPQNSPELVRKRVEEALNTFLHPLKGGTEGTGWQFGREVYKSEVYEVIEKIAGVDGVVDLSLSKGGNINELTLVYPGRHRIEIVLSQTICKEENICG
ncbi:putative baseplate assembly protein [bacterium]|nr:putative baseplate assembly protein [bacterium]MBU1752711.1 putative baseplate assembly protein [bacterium]